ncbi:cation diffusion facilitator family transporter [Clostridium perfringens]|uniref:cation diffusion facilitator family transporter n=1 Tax=Clostridium perfringens TaxID=1502 RepID=UPI0028E153EA|nr:cation diffusion facilitator family transporter [Clostridium perfringens]MDT9334949.1 cation diffusion facilitator family transporter [Clostridium perfringens]MDT9342709.1 cation diffusion facilitator family transporter [Clostridium perfringens]MDT9345889.1 cation diffusion facilitator family transporter [Clostridium perfringens]MDT9351793.1 cation diffusion facilitator family transporter [Clostridium perfringens]
MESRYCEANKVTIISILWNIVLAIIKISAGIIGKSNAMIADGAHSASDILSSVGVLIGNKIASIPKDKGHNYGHEKAETLVSFLLAILLVILSIKIGYNGGYSLFHLNEVQIPTAFPLVVSVISIIIKEYQYRITIKVAKKTNSPSLRADAWHHRSDALSSVAAFIGIGGAILGFKSLDSIASIVVALFIAKVGIEILIGSANELMDISIDEEKEKEIKTIVDEVEGIKSLREIRTRKYGAMAYVDLVICVDKDISVLEGHRIASDLENLILKKMKFIKGVTVHVEPLI